MKKKTILLLPLDYLPIPAVKGGAIETLVTLLLQENEKEKRVRFIVVSKYDAEAIKHKYKESKIVYLKNGCRYNREKTDRLLWTLYRIWRKLCQNRFTIRLFGKKAEIENFSLFPYYYIAVHNSVQIIVNEGREDDAWLAPLKAIVGEENIFNHLHFVRQENLRSRRAIPNSISISNYVKQQWVKDTSIDGINEVVFNGIDLSLFHGRADTKRREELRCSLGVKNDDFLVVFCGRIIPEKGVLELLEAFSLLSSNERIKLLLIGGYSDANKEYVNYKEIVENKINTLKNVISKGYVDNSELPLYYSLADVSVVPSVCQEGAGLVAIESMALGVPLIVTRVGGMVEYVDDNVAIVLENDNKLPQSLAEAITALSSNPQRCKEMSDSCRSKANSYSSELYYKNFVDLITRS